MSATDLGDPASTFAVLDSARNITRGHSCVSCQQRKVKCNGQNPCGACVKSRVECVVRAPKTPQRRRARKIAPQHDVLSRLRRCEEQLQLGGVDTQDDPPSEHLKRKPTEIETTRNESRSLERRKDTGKVIFERGHPRYVDNNLWTGLGDELQISNDITHKSTENDSLVFTGGAHPTGESLFFGCPTSRTLTVYHPKPVQIFKLWQTCLDNVNPLAKLFHAPTVQQLIVEAVSDLANITTSTESLMFAIYLSSVNSLGDEDCTSMMGESKALLIARFSSATQQALINAEVLRSSNLVVLQAFALFLLSMRLIYDPQTLWALTGLAIRVGQRIGLHRESISERLSPFEGEIRRRLWWQILILDRRSAQVCGAAVCGDSLLDKKTKRPLNVNDSDLNPAMKELPIEHIGVTDMLFCSIRYEIGEFMNNLKYWESFNGNGNMTNSSTSMADKDKRIDELENHLHQKFLKFCDPSISLHLLVTYLAKGVICQIRLTVHHPRQYKDKGEMLPPGEKKVLFSNSLKMIEYDNLAHTVKSLRGYLWHINVFFPFEAFIYVLGELSNSIQSETAILAWQNVDETYGHHLELITDVGNSLYFAIGNLAVKAWEKRIGSIKNDQGQYQFTMPEFISSLRSQRHTKPTKIAKSQSQDDLDIGQNRFINSEAQLYQHNDRNDKNQGEEISREPNPGLVPNYDAVDIEPMDWAYWQALIEGHDFPMLDNNGQQLFPNL